VSFLGPKGLSQGRLLGTQRRLLGSKESFLGKGLSQRRLIGFKEPFFGAKGLSFNLFLVCHLILLIPHKTLDYKSKEPFLVTLS